MAYIRNLEKEGLWIQRWITGLYTTRSPLFTPISALGFQIISRLDALIDGQNMEISPKLTLWRRPAYTRYCSVAFGASDIALNFHSFKNTSGVIKLLADTTNAVYVFTTTTNTASFTKNASAGRGAFFTVGDQTYYCNGSDRMKFDGTTWTNWGIAAPAAAPTVALVAGSLTTTSGYTYRTAYTNSNTGHVSQASAASANTGALTNQNVQVTVVASADAQVTNIRIYRTLDGGSVWYFLADVSNTNQTYTDSTTDANLNTAVGVSAALTPSNDICPANSSRIAWWDGHLWVASKNKIYWNRIGITGVAEESWDLTNNIFTVPNNVQGFAATTVGLFAFTNNTIFKIVGSKGIYFINPWQHNFGIAQPNAITQDGDRVIFFTPRSQLFLLSNNMEEIGFGIRSDLSTISPNSVSIALHRNQFDEGLFISDGSTNVRRYSLAQQCWSPAGAPVPGAGTVASIETTDSSWSLVMGAPGAGSYIRSRVPGNFTDDGGTYTCFATVGSLILSPPGKDEYMDMVLLSVTTAGTYPTVSTLINETSGTFTTLPNPVAEPPKLPQGKTLLTKRHWLKAATGQAQLVQHLQIKISFISEAAQNEILALGIK